MVQQNPRGIRGLGAQKRFNRGLPQVNFRNPASVYRADLRAGTPNVVGPYGSSKTTWKHGQPTVTTTLNQGQQQILDNRQQNQIAAGGAAQTALGQATNQLSNPYSLGGIGAVQGPLDMSGPNRYEDAIYNSFQRRMTPQFQQQQQQLQQQLADRGIALDSDAYRMQSANLAQQQGDMQLDAMKDAMTTGLAAQQQGWQQSYLGHQQGVSDYERQRYAGLNEAGQLMGLAGQEQVPQSMYQKPDTSVPAQIAMPRGGGGGGGGAPPPAGMTPEQIALMSQIYGLNETPSGGGGGNDWGGFLASIFGGAAGAFGNAYGAQLGRNAAK
jgi:hypothetical protein